MSMSMSMKSIDSSALDWSDILKLQDEYSRKQDLKKKQQQKLNQRLYKQQLESMIMQKKTTQRDDLIEDKKHLQLASEKLNTIAQRQLKEQQKWQRMRQNFSHDNYHSSVERKIKQREDVQSEKKKFDERFKKLSTEISQQKQHQKRSYSLKQHQLALAYDQQLNEGHTRKLLTKESDMNLQTIAHRIQEEKQKERLKNLNKIRFGYGQNHDIFNKFHEVLQKTQRQRNSFIDRVANSQKDIKQEKNERERQNFRLRKQVSTFNRQQFEQKMYRKRLSLIQETLHDKQKLTQIHQTAQQQSRQRSLQKQKQRNELQQELQRQIRDYEFNKISAKQMNPEEFKINSSLLNKEKIHGGSLLPGVAYDRQVATQQKLIEKFLRGS